MEMSPSRALQLYKNKFSAGKKVPVRVTYGYYYTRIRAY